MGDIIYDILHYESTGQTRDTNNTTVTCKKSNDYNKFIISISTLVHW